MEMLRTRRSPRCCCTSSVTVVGWFCTVKSTDNALWIAGNASGNSTSTTGPTTCTIFPVLMLPPSGSFCLAAGDLQQLLSDVPLPQLVVLEGKVLDHGLRVVGGVLHRHHACALLARFRVQQHNVDEDVEIVSEQIADDVFGTGFEQELGSVGRGFLPWHSRDL